MYSIISESRLRKPTLGGSVLLPVLCDRSHIYKVPVHFTAASTLWQLNLVARRISLFPVQHEELTIFCEMSLA